MARNKKSADDKAAATPDVVPESAAPSNPQEAPPTELNEQSGTEMPAETVPTISSSNPPAASPFEDSTPIPAPLEFIAHEDGVEPPAAELEQIQDMLPSNSAADIPAPLAEAHPAQMQEPNGAPDDPSPISGEAEALRVNLLYCPANQMQSAQAAEAEREHLRQRTQAILARVRKEADSLSPDLRKHLEAHVLANKMHDLNEKCFHDIQTFKSISLSFYSLRANSKAFLSLRPDQMAIWSEGSDGNNLVGLGFGTSTAPTLYLSNFLINAREMFLETYQDCSEIVLTLYVRTNQSYIKGKIDLPPGASITLQSRCDRSSIIGLSSFALDLE